MSAPNDPQGILGWLERNHPIIYGELLALDRASGGAIWKDPANHTISWHLANQCINWGHPLACLACKALNGLSPDHCMGALIAEKDWGRLPPVPGTQIT